jgi:hypothetical protein
MSTVNTITETTAANYAEHTGLTESVNRYSAVPAPEVDFSSVLADTLRERTLNTALTAGTSFPGMSGGFSAMPGGLPGMPGGGFMNMPNLGLEQMIQAAASSGDTNDAIMAVLMLGMMMQSDQGGDFSMLMQVMATMIGNFNDANPMRNALFSSNNDPWVMDTIDRNVFNWPMPATTGTGNADLPLQWWRPTTPAITNSRHQRSPAAYRAVVDQFNVENSERYRPGREGNTYCNIFVWDVTRAMGAEVPFYTDPSTGEPRFHPDTKGARAMGARAMCKWLETHGSNYGWREVDAGAAQMHANLGRPAITSSGSVGHVTMVVPSKSGTFDPARGVAIAQAGRNNINYGYIRSGYRADAVQNNVRYWIHA